MIPSKIEHPYAYPLCPLTDEEFHAFNTALTHLSNDVVGIRITLTEYLKKHPQEPLQRLFDAFYTHHTNEDLDQLGKTAKNTLMHTHKATLPNVSTASQLVAGVIRVMALAALTGEAVKPFPKPSDAELKSEDDAVSKRASNAKQIYVTYDDTLRVIPVAEKLSNYCQTWMETQVARNTLPPDILEGYMRQDLVRDALHDMVDRIDDAKALLDLLITRGAREATFTLPLQFNFTLAGRDIKISVNEASAILKEARTAATTIEKAAAKADTRLWYEAQRNCAQVFEKADRIIGDLAKVSASPLGHPWSVVGFAEGRQVRKPWAFSLEAYSDITTRAKKLCDELYASRFAASLESFSNAVDAATLAEICETPDKSWTASLTKHAGKNPPGTALPSH